MILFIISHKAYNTLNHFHQKPKTDVSFSKHHVSVVLKVFLFLAPSCMYIINPTSKHAWSSFLTHQFLRLIVLDQECTPPSSLENPVDLGVCNTSQIPVTLLKRVSVTGIFQ